MSDIGGKLASKSGKGGAASGRQVRLRLVYINLWSAAKLSFMLSLALAIAGIIMTFVLLQVIKATGMFTAVNDLLNGIADSGTDDAIDIETILGTARIMGFSILGAIVTVVVGTVIGALLALVYNLTTKITGGLTIGFANNK